MPPAKKKGAAGIRIRMYRVGFGDCFLMTFDDKQHVLIDCGVYRGTSGTGDIGSLADVVDDIASITDRKLALIVMTHRHADHIAGFGRHADLFRTFEVGAVWMPVWEAEYDKVAVAFQLELARLTDDVQRYLDRQIGDELGAAPAELAELYHRIGNATGLEPFGADGTKKRHGNNAIALELLKTGLHSANGEAVEPVYLDAGAKPALPGALATLGLTARVLGPPPVEDEALLRLMDLKKNVGQYLAMTEERLAAAASGDEARGVWAPFDRAWSVDGKRYPFEAFREWVEPRGTRDLDGAAVAAARARLEKQLAYEPTDELLELTAKQLDDYVNNQSLVVLFTFRGRNLLFAGDAQGGNWVHWLYETDEAIKAPTGPLATRAAAILEELDVYKVGHHGSTNATPIPVVERIRQGAVALCSTEANVYGKTVETAVPLGKLMDKLDERLALVRSDQLAITVDGEDVPAQVKAKLPAAKEGAFFKAGKLWIDYYL